jgi:sugar phosphate isomerase/epimerase
MINKLHISTIAEDAAELAREYGLGLEVTEFCTAFNMDRDFETWDKQVRGKIRDMDRLVFHAPFNELCPGAIDPLIAEVAKRRYAQAYQLMRGYGINAMIVHSGFVPMVYHEGWFAEKSIEFWSAFLADKPDDFRLYLENVMEPSPDMLLEIVRGVNDSRFRMCLDIGHAAIVGKGLSLTEWVERFLPFIGHVHLHNNHAERDTHSALDDGTIDLAPLIRTVANAVPDVTFTIETAGSARSSVEWLLANGL